MTTKATFTNSRGASIVFDTLVTSPYVLTAIPSGFGEVTAEKQTQKAPFQDGSTVTSLTLSEREISLDILIRGTSKEDISRKRQALSAVIDPRLGEG
uniref:phage tail family protein n=1 Tax=Staphylococcus aureus TaxID=1280 RepID=UPI0020BE7EA3